MTKQDNIIDIANENKSLVIHHLNRILIVSLSTLALALNGYQTSDIYMGLGAFVQFIQWMPSYKIWLFLSILIMGFLSLFYKTIVLLAKPHPARNS